MCKNLPYGFHSWIQFHDYLMKKDSLKYKKIKFMYFNPDKNVNESYSIYTETIYINCWKELSRLRISEADTLVLMHYLNVGMQHTMNKQVPDKLKELLYTIEIKDRYGKE